MKARVGERGRPNCAAMQGVFVQDIRPPPASPGEVLKARPLVSRPTDTAHNDLGGIGLALLSAAASGTLGLWGRLALTLHLTPPTLLGWRFGLTAPLLFALGFGRLPMRVRLELPLLSAVYTASTLLYFLALAPAPHLREHRRAAGPHRPGRRHPVRRPGPRPSLPVAGGGRCSVPSPGWEWSWGCRASPMEM